MTEGSHHMKNSDTREHYSAEYERLNDFLITGTDPAMQDFLNCHPFTQRESEILTLIALYGFSNREIAEQCMISEKTVQNHLANIMKKIGARSIRKLLSLLFNHVLYSQDSKESNY
ncbi:response regulator transcription factor [Paenibacillus sp. N3.4]|uniref:response regulator transcription factor n=1 Tax=Paenibacillus sp. N3.4 TaxID=2603222 RepID=UPI001C9C21BE|nr:helix-turn-helix transcriptional regulator [Paenibacillus sp. N3.4]